MTYRFKLDEPIAQGVRRIGLEQIEMAAAKLASKDDVAAAIHDARRCLKRLRALLRLIRPALSEAAYQRESERLAGIGRLLSGARDLFVMQQTVAKLETRFGALPNGTAAQLRKLMARGSSGGRRAAADGRRQALQRLAQAKRLFTGKAVEKIELDHIVDGLEDAYRRARKAFRQAYRKESNETFHAWRKRVQAHWRHMALLTRGWPEALSARAGEAKELSRLLGEDHDYAVLAAFAREQGGALAPEDLAALVARCEACQAELRAAARPRGERLFAEAADDLKERVALYWTSARSLAELAPKEGAGKAARAAGKQDEPGTGKTLSGARYRDDRSARPSPSCRPSTRASFRRCPRSRSTPRTNTGSTRTSWTETHFG